MQELLNVAKEAAFKAGEIHLKYYNMPKEISYKSNEFDLVTNVDKESEAIIIKTICDKFKNHGILAEESDEINKNAEFEWIIDPLDGTTNYAHNFPQFCVSIGLAYQKELCLGVVFDALKKELFYAVKNQGAFLNDKQINVSSRSRLSECLLATGFPYDRTNKENINFEYFKRLFYKSQAIRRPGAAALDMCYLACGRLDGFWELKLAPWDTAAASVIIREAGGIVTNFFANDFNIFIKSVIATNNKTIYNEMMQIIKEATPENVNLA